MTNGSSGFLTMSRVAGERSNGVKGNGDLFLMDHHSMMLKIKVRCHMKEAQTRMSVSVLPSEE